MKVFVLGLGIYQRRIGAFLVGGTASSLESGVGGFHPSAESDGLDDTGWFSSEVFQKLGEFR